MRPHGGPGVYGDDDAALVEECECGGAVLVHRDGVAPRHGTHRAHIARHARVLNIIQDKFDIGEIGEGGDTSSSISFSMRSQSAEAGAISKPDNI